MNKKALSKLKRFSRVTDLLYRGGQPDASQLKDLKSLGINTIISFRQCELSISLESTLCSDLDFHFITRPFSSVCCDSHQFFNNVLNDLSNRDHGITFIHCKHGKDRTSLVICLYLVIHLGWDRDKAWNEHAIAFDHEPDYMGSGQFRKFFDSYLDYFFEHQHLL